MADMSGKYIHLNDLAEMLKSSGIEFNLGDQTGTRRMVEVNGTPFDTAKVEVDDKAAGGPVLKVDG